MDSFDYFRDHVLRILGEMAAEGDLPAGLSTSRLSVEPPREEAHGDVTTNVAMVLAKAIGSSPRSLAAKIARRLEQVDEVASAEIAGPGFINLHLFDSFWQAHLAEIVTAGSAYGDSTIGGGRKVNVEYVSANPTGPMHVGHGRGAVVGDVLARLLEKVGFDVTREYCVNDAGAQVDVLARSLHLRYREALGETVNEVPEGLYPGDYLAPAGVRMAEREGDRWKDAPEQDWLETFRIFAIKEMMALIRKDLAALGIEHAVFASERELVAADRVRAVLDDLKSRGLIYRGVLPPPKGKKPDDWEPREQMLFKASEFGDDMDRPVARPDGSWTYFATDMAYHRDKFERGFKTMIDVWGADHGGYVRRMQAAVKALTDGQGELDVKLCQMINLLDDGEPVKMSKRAGVFVTLRDVIGQVGKDVVRFIMLTRKNDAHLDFDLTSVLEQSKDNPVFYVQYAHARARSVMRLAAEVFDSAKLEPRALAGADLSLLIDPAELGLIKQMTAWPRLVESAAKTHEPHRIAYYLNDLASRFHILWNKGKDDATLRFLIPEEPELTHARLALIQGVALVIASGLEVFGVIPAEEMR